jgi:MFS family permease
MPDLRLTLIFLHVAFVMLFVLVHGGSAVIAFRLRSERDPARVAALLDASRLAVNSWVMIVGMLGFVITGIWLGFVGGYWGKAWLWTSIVVLVVVVAVMTPMGALRLRRARVAYGLETGRDKEPPPPADLVLAEQELQAWNPLPISAVGGVGLLVVLWLMIVKPF